jgi:HAD superfamily hydrolase (TIGR01458 family)
MIKALLLDIAGVLEQDGEAIAGSPEAVSRLRKKGYQLRFITNSSRRSRHTLCQDLRRLGYSLTEDDVFTAPLAIRHYLERKQLSALLLVDAALEAEFAGLTAYPRQAVVVCDAGEGFTYAALNRAFQAVMDGAPLLAVGDNRYFRAGGKYWMDAGPFVRAIEYAAGVQAQILGKPAAGFFHAATAAMDCEPGSTLMVGDDVHADVVGALEAGLSACLVRSGKYRPGDESQVDSGAALVCDDLLQLLDCHL